MNENIVFIIGLIILLLLTIFIIIALLIRNKKDNIKFQSNQEKLEESLKINEQTTTFAKEQAAQKTMYMQQLNNLVTEISKEKAEKQEIAKRRRVTTKDKENVFKRDNKTCQICGISYDFVENLCEGLGDYLLLEIDHIQSVAQGGTGAEEDNLQCLCWRCNRKKGGKKTNDDIKSKINYGIGYLKPKYLQITSVAQNTQIELKNHIEEEE